jgi:hypothetical protein
MNFARVKDRLGELPYSKKISSRARGALLLTAILAPMALLWGCSGVVSGQSTQQPPPQTFSISGAISPVAGGSGATVTLSGAASATTTANSSGNYTFSGLANGTYTVTPSHAGYTFNPTSLNLTVSGANITTGLNFTATALAGTHSISGTISPAASGSGATVTLSGAASASTTANSSGNYTLKGLTNGNYAVTPSRTGYTFSPTTQSATVNGANVTGLNFTGTAVQTFSISGTISPAAGGSGATVTLSGAASASTTANSSGNYTFTGLANGAYTATPSKAGYTFTPVNRSVTINGANVSAVNFTATPQQTQAHSATLSWTASTSAVSGYNVYRGTVNGGPYTLITLSLVTGPSYTDTTVLSGVTYYYVTTAVDSNGVESVISNQVTAIIP